MPDSDIACRICKVEVVGFPGPLGTDVLVHGRPWNDYDHEPDPVPVKAVPGMLWPCDFCGQLGATWQYHGDHVAYGADFDGLEEIDKLWRACEDCDPFVKTGNIAALSQRYQSSPTPRLANDFLRGGNPTSEQRRQQLIRASEQLWSTFIPTIRRRERIPQIDPLPPMRPAQMPKIRDRIVDFWHSEMALLGMRSDITNDGYIHIPGVDAGYGEDVFAARLRELSDEHAKNYISRITQGLLVGDLYWISRQFTNLAVNAGKQLPDITINRDELPSTNGLVIWADPIYELSGAEGGHGQVRAAAWTLVPGGMWITVYMPPEDSGSRAEPALIRQRLGWVIPWSSGGGMPWGTHEMADPAKGTLMKTLVSTWLLMRQPGVADTVQEKIHADIRKSYRKARRTEPTVSVINIRRTQRAPRPTDEQATRNYTGSWAVGVRTGGFWRTYWTGSGRATRDRRWIDPYIARADLPMKSEPKTTPTVRVLK